MMPITLPKIRRKESVRELYDVIIVGAGAAGVSAAIYSSRRNLRTLVIDKFGVGGKLLEAGLIENYPGFTDILGPELAQLFEKHMTKFGAEFLVDEVVNINKFNGMFIVDLASGNSVKSRVVIYCGGAEHRKLNVPGEDKFLGRGVSYCATCDGFFFKDKIVGVVGGGDTAVSYALYLSDICKLVYLIHRRRAFRAEDILVEKLKEKDNVEFIIPYIVTEIRGEGKVESILVKNRENDAVMELKLDGLFIAIGYKPNINALLSLKPETFGAGYLKVDERMRTSVEGLYAAGDITGFEKQLVVAAAQGAIAALSAAEYVRHGKWK